MDPSNLPNPLSVPGSILRSATDIAWDLARSDQTARQVSRLERLVMRRRYHEKLEEGSFRGVWINVHRGWVAQGVARVHLQVLETPRLPESSRIPYWEVATTNLRRHVNLAFPGVPVRVTLAGTTVEQESDQHGFVAVQIPAADLAPGWHEVEARIAPVNPGDPDFVGRGRVLLPPDDARIAIISDIDDTVIRTGLAEGLSAFRRTLFGEAETRRSIPGMSSLYRGLSRGVPDRDGRAPGRPGTFYISTGSWDFYEMLVQFLQLRGYPRGPLFLTDWWPTEERLYGSGRAHKEQAIRRIAEGYPELPLVLIGDSGQSDPEIYSEFAAEYPGRAQLILILDAGKGSAENTAAWREKSKQLRADGIPIHVISDALEGARMCRDLGMCDELTVEEVETEMGALF